LLFRTRPFAGAVALATVALALTAVARPASAQSSVTKTNNTIGNFDASSGTRDFIVTAADMASGVVVSTVEISIDFEKFSGPTLGVDGGGTPFFNEMEFTLTNPVGVTTTLIAADSFDVGDFGFRGVIRFTDAALNFVNIDPDLPSAGSFRPTGPGTMADLNAASGVGTWTLTIQDFISGDHLGFYSATLRLNPNAASTSAPEPGTFALCALSVIGAAVARRRRH
jgi:MYXO-CTERM domain-containing protein